MSLILFLADWNVEKMIAEIHFGAPTLSARISPADGRGADGKTSAFPPDLVSLIKSTALKKPVSQCGGREGGRELMAGGCVTTDSECRLLSRQLWMECRSSQTDCESKKGRKKRVKGK